MNQPDIAAAATESAPDNCQTVTTEPSSWWKSLRPLIFACLVLVLIAIAIGGAAWFRAGNGSPQFNSDQTAQAKTNVCSAYVTVRQAVVENTHLTIPNPGDRIAQLAVAANARLALLGGGSYLQDRLDAEHAAPTDLSFAVTALSATVQQLGADYLAGADDSLQVPLRRDLDTQISKTNALCK
jgi:hypothetical protein